MHRLLLALLLTACGGGGGNSSSGTITPAPVLRTDLYCSYYAQNADTVLETTHCNLLFLADFYGIGDQIKGLSLAGDRKVVLMVPAIQGEAVTRGWLTAVRNSGHMRNVVALYPVDEPDTDRVNLSDEQVKEMVSWLRPLMREFPELADTKLWVFYNCSSGKRPGISVMDAAGCDDYDRGCDVATGSRYLQMKGQLRPDQGLLFPPGGAAPWQQDPACFAHRAHSDPQVVAIVSFIWQTVTDGQQFKGIRDIPQQRRLYCEMGRSITGSSLPC